MADGIQRWDGWTDPETGRTSIEKCVGGGFVLFSDVRARLEAADARIKELEAERDGLNREIESFTDEIEWLNARIEKADRLAIAVAQFLAPCEGVEVTMTEVAGELMAARQDRLTAALSEYRDDPKVGEIRGFIVNVDCPIHGAPAVASVSDVKTNVEEDASHE